MKPQSRATKTPAQVNAEQRTAAEAATAKRKAEAASWQAPATSAPKNVPAVPDRRDPTDRYLDDVAGGSFEGRLIKFSKEGKFITVDDGEEVPQETEFVALCDQVFVGWIKFAAPGEPPTRIGGLLFDNFILPPRESLGDLDPSQWEEGLNNEPQDPWRHEMVLPLQNLKTDELMAFTTMSVTGRRAVGRLLRNYQRLRRDNRDGRLITRLVAGGFEHRDPRVGWVCTPSLPLLRNEPRPSPRPAPSQLARDMEDTIPF